MSAQHREFFKKNKKMIVPAASGLFSLMAFTANNDT
ncbi:hypothetical protein BN432_2542 [Erwinia amylovora Ea356]|nr:hypothetical protein BN432_2542 [Erwinia amylovora Ea356]